MFKLDPFISEKIWGYERWLVSVHPHGQSQALSAGGGQPLSAVAPEYPLLIKLIQANDTLSVQVHPDDEYARAHENSRGKTECWYILDASEDAAIYCGLEKDFSKEQLAEALKNGNFETCLKRQPVRRGDFVYIAAGTVHALGGGIRLLEVQESSDITYRLYDWGRQREMHITQGLQVISYGAPSPLVSAFSGAFECPYFALRTVSGGELTDKNDFVLFVLDGSSGKLHCNTESVDACAEDTFFCRGGETVRIDDGISALCICLP